jgi:hypothetical protein
LRLWSLLSTPDWPDLMFLALLIPHLLASEALVSGSSILTIVGIFVGVSGAFFGGLMGWLAIKKKNSGKIETSEASSLWNQTQILIQSLQRDKELAESKRERAEEQRDRVIDTIQTQMVPALTTIRTSQVQLAESVNEVITVLKATGPLPPTPQAYMNRLTDAVYEVPPPQEKGMINENPVQENA